MSKSKYILEKTERITPKVRRGRKAAPPGFTPLRSFMTKSDKLVTTTLTGDPIDFPKSSTYRSKPCQPAGKKDKKGPKTLKACHMELTWVPTAEAAKRGVKAGPNLRYCTKLGEPGRLFPVSSALEAKRVIKEFCSCRVESDADTCASAIGRRASLSGFKKRRS